MSLPTQPALDIERISTSLASMLTEYVEGGINSNQNWRNGLNEIIQARLRRLLPPAAHFSSLGHEPANAGEPLYRFLRIGDVIEAGDECPSDNCERWEPVNRWAVGLKVSIAFKTMRRRIAAIASPATGGEVGLGIVGISADIESKRVLKLHYKHEATAADRKNIIDAINALNETRRAAPATNAEHVPLPIDHGGVGIKGIG